MKTIWIMCIAAAAATAGAATAEAATLELRGKLTDRRGFPLDGACLLRFTVGDAWSDAFYVEVEEGLFRTTLGKKSPIPESALEGALRLGVWPPKGTGWQASASPVASRPAAEAADERALLRARIEALERQVPQEPRERRARLYEVRAGDTLQSVAAGLWGDSSRWSELYAANSDRIGRGGELRAGQKLVVPEVPR
ncbi:MAG: LysM peptidoglycan-binding domain-containing protein [Elusimicrobia bacterium]|nr:LysM peptidoglycan-binding domain-containing protein [Elusimicrobiota bacterium]